MRLQSRRQWPIRTTLMGWLQFTLLRRFGIARTRNAKWEIIPWVKRYNPTDNPDVPFHNFESTVNCTTHTPVPYLRAEDKQCTWRCRHRKKKEVKINGNDQLLQKLKEGRNKKLELDSEKDLSYKSGMMMGPGSRTVKTTKKRKSNNRIDGCPHCSLETHRRQNHKQIMSKESKQVVLGGRRESSQ